MTTQTTQTAQYAKLADHLSAYAALLPKGWPTAAGAQPTAQNLSSATAIARPGLAACLVLATTMRDTGSTAAQRNALTTAMGKGPAHNTGGLYDAYRSTYGKVNMDKGKDYTLTIGRATVRLTTDGQTGHRKATVVKVDAAPAPKPKADKSKGKDAKAKASTAATPAQPKAA